MKFLITALAFGVLAAPVKADITVQFDEGAPKDRFSIVNGGTCPLGEMQVKIDLAGSSAGLIFDVTGQGAGVMVFQPLELVAGRELLREVPQISDGDNSVTLNLTNMAPAATVAFTIDVDDTAGQSETMVSGQEITGAVVEITSGRKMMTAKFDENAVAQVAMSGCNA